MFESAAAFARDAEALPIKFLLRGSFTESAPLVVGKPGSLNLISKVLVVAPAEELL